MHYLLAHPSCIVLSVVLNRRVVGIAKMMCNDLLIKLSYSIIVFASQKPYFEWSDSTTQTLKTLE